MINAVRAHAADIASKPNAFIAVGLSVMQMKDLKVAAELNRIVRRFAVACRWTPAQTHFVAGALPYTRYNVLMRWIMKRMVGRAGGDTDISRDYVYTDWDDLKRFVVEFGRSLTTAAA